MSKKETKSIKALRDNLARTLLRVAELEAEISDKTEAECKKLAGMVGPYVARMVQQDAQYAASLAEDIDRLLQADGIGKKRDRDAKIRVLLQYCTQQEDDTDTRQEATTPSEATPIQHPAYVQELLAQGDFDDEDQPQEARTPEVN